MMIEWYILACTHSLAHTHTHSSTSIEFRLYCKTYTTMKSTKSKKKKKKKNWIQIRTLFNLVCGPQASEFSPFARNYYAFMRVFCFQILCRLWFYYKFFFFSKFVHISHSRTTLKKSRCFFFLFSSSSLMIFICFVFYVLSTGVSHE